MNTERAIPISNQPLGTDSDLRRRFLLHHLPLALASALILVAFMSLPLFDAAAYPHPDIISGTFPQQRGGDGTEPTSQGQRHGGLMGRDRNHAGSGTRSMDHGRHHAGSGKHRGSETEPSGGDVLLSSNMQQFTVATGYLAAGLLALTLVLGPANLLLRRRNPVSNYLRRDVGTWTAIFSVVHVMFALLIHVSHGRGLISSFLHFFVAEDGGLLTNSFGLGNWTGLAALLIVVGLLATSTDAALRKLKARPWKWLQRLNYALFALVVLHAFFYGALLRLTSPFTLLLGLCVSAVFVGQALGIWLYRRRRARTAMVV